MRPHRIAAFLLAAFILTAAEYDPAEVLRRLTAKELDRTSRLPNCTCVQTVVREYYKPRAATLPRSCPVLMDLRRHPTPDMVLQFFRTDRLRLDVTLTDRGEIYSWAGASRFEDAHIDEVVREGPIGTGPFGGFLSLLVHQFAAVSHFERAQSMAGRNLLEYSFAVPQEGSHYRIKADKSWIPVAYSGTFDVDPNTGDLVRLRVDASALPLASGSCNTVTELDYVPVRIGDSDFLLPHTARQHYVAYNGEESENTTTFANCREYRGESSVTFSPPPEPAGPKTSPTPARPAALPIGLPFTFELTTPIATDTAAAGDRFSGRLVSALRYKGKTLAPAHAAIEGRLLRVENLRLPPVRSLLVLSLRTIEIGGVPVPLSVDRDWRALAVKRQKMQIALPNRWERNAIVIEVPGERAILPAGSRSQWQTVPNY